MTELLPEFIGNHPILSLAFVGLLITLIHNEISMRTRGFKAVTPGQLTQLINSRDAAILDVSTAPEFDKGHIVGAFNITPTAIDPDDKRLSSHREQPLAVVCKNGMQSETISKKLRKAGFSELFWLKGGVQAWATDQLPLVTGKAAKSASGNKPKKSRKNKAAVVDTDS